MEYGTLHERAGADERRLMIAMMVAAGGVLDVPFFMGVIPSATGGGAYIENEETGQRIAI